MTANPNNRLPPHSIELETQVLSAAMYFAEDHLAPLLDACKPEDFYVPVHAKLMQLLAAQYARHAPTDSLSLRAAAADDAALVACIDGLGVCIAPDISAMCEQVALLAQNRRTIQTAFKLAELGLQSGQNPGPFFDVSQKMIASLVSDGNVKSRPKDSADLANEFYSELQRPIPASTTIRTGLCELDRRLGGGLQSGRLYVAAGRPGMGKSALVFQAMVSAARDGHRALGFTLEMKAPQLQARLLAHESGIDSRSLRTAAGDERAGELSVASSRLSQLPYAIVDDARVTVQQLRLTARRERAKRGLKLVVVDYLQLMASEGRHDTREQEVASISRELKKLANELDIAVLAACQLNRNLEQRADKRPMLSDLRESGAIEQDADVVMLLYRDDYYDENSKERGLCDIGIAKWRDGDTGVVRTLFERETSTFKTLARA
jgi:replicative DNA helicase